MTSFITECIPGFPTVCELLVFKGQFGQKKSPNLSLNGDFSLKSIYSTCYLEIILKKINSENPGTVYPPCLHSLIVFMDRIVFRDINLL